MTVQGLPPTPLHPGEQPHFTAYLGSAVWNSCAEHQVVTIPENLGNSSGSCSFGGPPVEGAARIDVVGQGRNIQSTSGNMTSSTFRSLPIHGRFLENTKAMERFRAIPQGWTAHHLLGFKHHASGPVPMTEGTERELEFRYVAEMHQFRVLIWQRTLRFSSRWNAVKPVCRFQLFFAELS